MALCTPCGYERDEKMKNPPFMTDFVCPQGDTVYTDNE